MSRNPPYQNSFTRMSVVVALLISLVVFLPTCGKGKKKDETVGSSSGDSSPPPPTFSVGGFIQGLTGRIVIENLEKDDIDRSANGLFTFSARFEDGAIYDVIVRFKYTSQTCLVENGRGTINGANVTDVIIKCVEPSWTHPSDLANDHFNPEGNVVYGGGEQEFDVAMDDLGQAIITWRQIDDSTDCNGSSCDQIFLSEYRNGTWTHPSGLGDNISPNGQKVRIRPKIAMDRNGDALLGWSQYDGTSFPACDSDYCLQAFMSEYRHGSWIHPSDVSDNISINEYDSGLGDISMTDFGNAGIVRWQNVPGSRGQVFRSEYLGSSWYHPMGLTEFISISGANARFPSLAISKNGEEAVIWEQPDYGFFCRGANACWQIFVREIRDGILISPVDRNDNLSRAFSRAGSSEIVMDDRGNTVVIWTQRDNTADCGGDTCRQLFMAQYTNKTWTKPASRTDHISFSGTVVNSAEIAMNDEDGDAVIVWSQHNGTHDQIYISEYRRGLWTHPTDLTDSISPLDEDATRPHVAMNRFGETIITWQQSPGIFQQIYKSEYRDGSWIHPASISQTISPALQHAEAPRVAMDNIGNAIIVWHQFDGTNKNLYMSEYR